MTPRFTIADVDRLGLNCGPTAFAAILGLTLDEARPHFGDDWPGYTNPTCMFVALASAIGPRGKRWRIAAGPKQLGAGVSWPSWGLCRIQWHGRWMAPGVPIAARYRQTHWVGCCTDPARGVGIWDVNALNNSTGWCALADWERVLVPHLTAEIKGADDGWSITHAVEVQRP
ncbi:MAG TPA: hypothetical protein VFQ42_22110 [Mycobacterium sp.]|nr:hypothetical protein [Mycobacterium sp.]